jgi:hypothetical protein
LTDILYQRHTETIAWLPPDPYVEQLGKNACCAGVRRQGL